LSSATRTAWHCPHLLLRRRAAAAAPAVQQSTHISYPPRAHCSKPAARCCSGRMGQTGGQTDRRTPYRFRDPATRTYYRAVPMNPIQNKRGQCCLIIAVCQKYQLKRVPHTTRTLGLTFPEDNIGNRNTLHKKVSASQTTRDNLILFVGTAT